LFNASHDMQIDLYILIKLLFVWHTFSEQRLCLCGLWNIGEIEETKCCLRIMTAPAKAAAKKLTSW